MRPVEGSATLRDVSRKEEDHVASPSAPGPSPAWVRYMRKFGVGVAGAVVTVLGVALSLPGIPGPGFLVILLGLGILSLEFEWADRLRARLQARFRDAVDSVRERRAKR
jgi:uncharacterized protein (TIGR02611 family)